MPPETPNAALTRRTMLAGLGTAIAAVPLSVSGRAEDTVQMVAERRGDRTYHAKTVPQPWLDRVKRTERARTAVRAAFGDREGVLDVRIVPGEETVAGKGVNHVAVVVEPDAPVIEELPDAREDVPVTVRERGTNRLKHQRFVGCHGDENRDALIGGLPIAADADGNGGADATGTGACPVTRDGVTFYLTANHLFDAGDGCEGNWNDNAWYRTRESDRFIGDVSKYRQRLDFALAGPLSEGSLDPDPRIANARWSGEVVSHVTRPRCHELMAEETPVAKTGIATGEQTGPMTALSASFSNGCVDLDGDGVVIDADCAAGDSGGPYYVESESDAGDVAMVALHSGTPDRFANGRTCNRDTFARAAGAAAYRVASELDLTFGVE